MIRDAKKSDLPIMLHMGELFFNASDFSELTTYDRDSVRSTMTHLMDSGVLLVGESEGIVVGMVGAMIYPFYFNNSHITGQELFWWVNEDQRKSGVGKKLLSGLEDKAKSMGVDSFSMVALEKMNPEIMDRVYKMSGYFSAEHTYYKRMA